MHNSRVRPGLTTNPLENRSHKKSPETGKNSDLEQLFGTNFKSILAFFHTSYPFPVKIRCLVARIFGASIKTKAFCSTRQAEKTGTYRNLNLCRRTFQKENTHRLTVQNNQFFNVEPSKFIYSEQIETWKTRQGYSEKAEAFTGVCVSFGWKRGALIEKAWDERSV